jgi:Mce-associated membrane protein
MSTTRHHINRRRRMAAAASRSTPPATPARGPGPEPEAQQEPREPAEPAGPAPSARRRRLRRPPALPLLAAAVALLTAFGIWAGAAAERAADVPAAANTALTDNSATGELTAAAAAAVAAAFSYDHADPEGSARAAAGVLTGQAVEQRRELLAELASRGAEEELVLRTSVTHSGVETLQGDRARVLVFADQRSSRAGEEDVVTGALLAVDMARQDGEWRITAIETFG